MHREEFVIHSLLLDGYSNNPMVDPLNARAAELHQQGVTVCEGYTYARDSASTFYHWIEYADDTIPSVEAEPKARQAVTSVI